MNKLVLVSGANRGLGKEVFKIFSESWKDSTVMNINRSGVGELGDLDFKDKNIDFSGITKAIEAFESVIYINNLATIEPIKSVKNLSHKEIEDTTYTNFINPLKLISLLSSTNRNVFILNITTGAAFSVNTSLGLYSSTKAALHKAVEVCNKEEESDKLIAINYDPGRMETDMQRQLAIAKGFSLADVSCRTPFEVSKEIFNLINVNVKKLW